MENNRGNSDKMASDNSVNKSNEDENGTSDNTEMEMSLKSEKGSS